MFGIALDLTADKFGNVFQYPKKVIVGLVSQLIILPLFTFLIILLFKPQPSIALGMILVSACPGGNISNFISSLAKANVALSITITTISSLLSVIFTPLNFSFYGGLYKPAHSILKEVSLDWIGVVMTIGGIIFVPLIIGFYFRKIWPSLALKLSKPLERFSMFLFLMIVVGALFSNFTYFKECIAAVFFLVLVHNSVALITGYTLGHLFGFDFMDKKSLAIETGIQNSGLGLLLIFSFFDGLGGMAIVTAWWGIWHIVSGFTLVYIWRR